MPTYDKTETFRRGYKHLSRRDQEQFLAALRSYIEDLEARDAGLASTAIQHLSVADYALRPVHGDVEPLQQVHAQYDVHVIHLVRDQVNDQVLTAHVGVCLPAV